jgi:hypothetical protein
MNKLKRVLGLILVWTLFGSCVDQISFPLEKADEEKLIVSGVLTDLNETQYVFLSETTSNARQPIASGQYFVLNDLPRPIQGASVVLAKEGSGNLWFYQETKPGQYELNGFRPVGGEGGYYLEVRIGNRVYRSNAHQFPEVVGSDELSFSFQRGQFGDSPETSFVSIVSKVTLPQQVGGYYLRWMVEEAYYWNLTFFPNPFNTPPPNCFVFGYPDPERINLLNGDLLNNPGGQSSLVLAQRGIDQSFLSRHYFMVRQLSIDKEAHEYWRKVLELVNNSGSVFDSPPAPIRGNIRRLDFPNEMVLGYFEVAKASIKRIYTTRADVPYFIEDICAYVPGKSAALYPPTCRACSAFPNSTSQVPSWWFDQ